MGIVKNFKPVNIRAVKLPTPKGKVSAGFIKDSMGGVAKAVRGRKY